MNYSIHPFPSHPSIRDAYPDIRRALATKTPTLDSKAIPNADLLDATVNALRDISSPFHVSHCHENAGDLHISITAATGGHEVSTGDQIRGGLFIQNSESCRFDTLICTRIYRVVCDNGMLTECEKEQVFELKQSDQPPADYAMAVGHVVARSFNETALVYDYRRFKSTENEILVTPFEFLCNLAAQNLITDDEQSIIQTIFNENADFTLYGLLNAVTQSAHDYRASDQWIRAFQIERLAGEILRGDHNLPSYSRVYS